MVTAAKSSGYSHGTGSDSRGTRRKRVPPSNALSHHPSALLMSSKYHLLNIEKAASQLVMKHLKHESVLMFQTIAEGSRKQDVFKGSLGGVRKPPGFLLPVCFSNFPSTQSCPRLRCCLLKTEYIKIIGDAERRDMICPNSVNYYYNSHSTTTTRRNINS